ncbi:MAG TPA: hypothetical protein VFW73_11665 [Lacipirellulaceae bacterium]|nr:hypothetical protein [Lacipirellulaceae bacterium]
MLMESAKEYRALRAPAGDGETLIDPPWSELSDVVARNVEEFARVQYDVQGRSLGDLSGTARRGLLDKALRYTRQYRDVPERWQSDAVVASEPFVLSGHQPELFHPGVWYKNFVLGALAKKLDGIGIHLLIDSDTCRGASIRVPTGSISKPRSEAVLYDEPTAEVPHEERTIHDATTFSTFGERAASLVRPLVADPMVGQLWRLVMERNPSQQNLGLRLAQGRHALEESWRNETLELPQSMVCELPEFGWFVAHVLANLPRFWAAYNDALAQYRRAHHIRGHAQPVPDLDARDGWLEAPFWIWSSDDPQRRPLFARQSSDEIVITDRRTNLVSLSLTDDGDAAEAAEQVTGLASRGIKLRTRALTTTLFARLLLSDLFLHGIGGARYDQVTDEIVRQFFGFEPPAFAAVSATLRLPIACEPGKSTDVGQWQHQLRELQFHPERYIELNGDDTDPVAVAKFVAVKRRWVATPKTPENASERHRAIVAANEGLQPFVAPVRRRIERERDEVYEQKRSEAILGSREYSFCLYPRQHFEKLISDLR